MLSKSGCMDCGAPITFDEFSPFASCPSCGTAHRLPRDNSGAWVLTYDAELLRSEAVERAMEIVGPTLGKSRRTKLEIIEVFPIYLPVWKFVTEATGWFRTGDEQILPVNIKKELSLPAYENASAIGVPHEVSGSDAHISPESQFPMLHVKIGLSDLKKSAEEQMIREISSFGNVVDPGRAVSVNIVDSILALYPAWIVRFRTRNGEHSLTIDGITGQSMNVVDIQVTDEKLLSEVLLATASGSMMTVGVAMSSLEGIHGLEIGLCVAGLALFGIVNILRLALRSSRLSPRPKGRKVSA